MLGGISPLICFGVDWFRNKVPGAKDLVKRWKIPELWRELCGL
jgi:hypothetical protein